MTQPWFGVQFHPEVTHTQEGKQLLDNFVGICGCQKTWKTARIIDEIVQDLRETIGTSRVILALSGGVDSSVTALLLHRAIGEQLQCVFVDHGLLRLNEATEVQALFDERLGFKSRNRECTSTLYGKASQALKSLKRNVK